MTETDRGTQRELSWSDGAPGPTPAPPPAGSRYHSEKICVCAVRAEGPGPRTAALTPAWPYPATGPHDGASVRAGGGEMVHTRSGPDEDTWVWTLDEDTTGG